MSGGPRTDARLSGVGITTDSPSERDVVPSGNDVRSGAAQLESLHLDDTCWRILKALSYAPKTPQMLARIHGMPIADAWKRVHFLEGLGLVHIVLTFITREGRILYFYEAGRDALTVVSEDASVSVYFQPAP